MKVLFDKDETRQWFYMLPLKLNGNEMCFQVDEGLTLVLGGSGLLALGALAGLGAGVTDDNIMDESLPPEVELLVK